MESPGITLASQQGTVLLLYESLSPRWPTNKACGGPWGVCAVLSFYDTPSVKYFQFAKYLSRWGVDARVFCCPFSLAGDFI